MRFYEFSSLRENATDNEDSRALELGDTRKPRLTLRMVNRLKKIRATKSLETVKKASLLTTMYGGGGEDDSSF